MSQVQLGELGSPEDEPKLAFFAEQLRSSITSFKDDAGEGDRRIINQANMAINNARELKANLFFDFDYSYEPIKEQLRNIFDDSKPVREAGGYHRGAFGLKRIAMIWGG